MKTLHNVAIILTLTAASVAHADIVQPDFSDTSQWQLNGSAATLTPNADDLLRLTNSTGQSGSAFSTNAISLDGDVSFSAAFQFSITNPISSDRYDGGLGADGLVFALQTVSNTAGGSGGGIGYAGISNSLGVEFDTYYNSNTDINGNHVGINTDGSQSSLTSAAVDTDFVGSGLWTAWVDYDGIADLLEVRLANDGVRSQDALLSYSVDLSTIFGSSDVFVGFTSGTGGAGAEHNIHNLQFNDTFEPITTAPETDVNAPLALSLAGLVLLGCASRRRA